MTHSEALEILEIEESSLLDPSSLKKHYRKLIKKYHPDNKNIGSEDKTKDINNAYRYLIRNGFDTVIKPSITLGNLINKYKLRDRNLSDDLIVKSKAVIFYKSNMMNVECREVRNSKDIYNINYAFKYDLGDKAKVSVENQEKEVNLNSNLVSVEFNFEYLVRLRVNIVNKVDT